MRLDVRKLISSINFQKNRKYIVIAVAAVFCLFLLLSVLSSSDDELKRPDMPLNITALGGVPNLDQAMKESGLLKQRVKKLLSYDVAYLFANYRQINGEIVEILFFWSGLPSEKIKEIGAKKAIDFFLRRVHDLPDDETTVNNPVLGPRPWPRLFNRYKVRLLLLGNAYKIYDGLCYYDSIEDKIYIDPEATLSKEFMEGFAGFLLTRPEKDRKAYINNLLVFIDDTKGLRNLSEEEKILVQSLGK